MQKREKGRRTHVRIPRILIFAYVALNSLFLVGYAVYLTATVRGNPLQLLLALLFLLLAVILGILSSFVAYFYAYSGACSRNDRGCSPPRKLPSVALAVATCNEEGRLVKQTLVSLKKIEYPRDKLEWWILDNSDEPEARTRNEKLARQNGYTYVYHERKEGFKAGSLNNLLGLTKAGYLVVFDSDEKLFDSKFLLENIGWFYRVPKLAFVQTEKRAANPSSLFSRAVEAIFGLFYDSVQPLRSEIGIAMYTGSQGILDVSILRKLGGFPAHPPMPAEDTHYSLVASFAGYQGIYVAKAYAYGEPVENFSTYARQQWKYSYGNARLLPTYLDRMGELKGWKVHLHYLANFFGFPYSSLVVILLAFLSSAFVLSNLSFTMVTFSEAFSVFSTQDRLWLNVMPILATVINLVVIARFYFGSFRVGLMATALNLALAFRRSEAALAASTRDLSEIEVTSKSKVLSGSVFAAMRLTRVETAYGLFFLALAVFSVLRGDLAGGFWMMWYSFMFSFALIFAMRYG